LLLILIEVDQENGVRLQLRKSHSHVEYTLMHGRFWSPAYGMRCLRIISTLQNRAWAKRDWCPKGCDGCV